MKREDSQKLGEMSEKKPLERSIKEEIQKTKMKGNEC